MEYFDTWVFDAEWYLKSNPDVAIARINPLVHFHQWGRREHRSPSPFFNPRWYKHHYDLPFECMDALTHYMLFGHVMGYEPCEGFNTMVSAWNELTSKTEEQAIVLGIATNSEGYSPYAQLMQYPQYPKFKHYFENYKLVIQSMDSIPSPHPSETNVREFVVKLSTAHANQLTLDITDESATTSLSIGETTAAANHSVAVVYLLPVDSSFVHHFQMWLYSYVKFCAGLEHKLVVVLKNYHGQPREDCLKLAEQLFPQLKFLNHRLLLHENEGFDIRSYIQFSKEHGHEYDCILFTTTYAIMCCDNWLQKMNTQLMSRERNTSLVGSTGGAGRSVAHFPNLPLPNLHVRTSVFMARSIDLNTLEFEPVVDKLGGYKFEHGPCSLTQQMMKIGNVGIVGKDGTFYPPSEWKNANAGFSNTTQTNLMIADARTENWRINKIHWPCFP
jgi:hypothetical protein